MYWKHVCFFPCPSVSLWQVYRLGILFMNRFTEKSPVVPRLVLDSAAEHVLCSFRRSTLSGWTAEGEKDITQLRISQVLPQKCVCAGLRVLWMNLAESCWACGHLHHGSCALCRECEWGNQGECACQCDVIHFQRKQDCPLLAVWNFRSYRWGHVDPVEALTFPSTVVLLLNYLFWKLAHGFYSAKRQLSYQEKEGQRWNLSNEGMVTL